MSINPVLSFSSGGKNGVGVSLEIRVLGSLVSEAGVVIFDIGLLCVVETASAKLEGAWSILQLSPAHPSSSAKIDEVILGLKDEQYLDSKVNAKIILENLCRRLCLQIRYFK